MNFEEYTRVAWGSKEHKMTGDRLYRWERLLSARLSWYLVRLFPSIQPSTITLLSIVILLSVFTTTIIMIVKVNYTTPFLFIGSLVVLYIISILDKIDGEIARATNRCTQKGLYYDRAVHFLFPLIFYLLIGTYFLILGHSIIMWYLTILLGLLTQQLIFFGEAKLLIGEKIRKNKIVFSDLLQIPPPKKRRPNVLFRVIEYTTFMIYSFTLFFYVGLGLLSFILPTLVFCLYSVHIITSLIVNIYKTYISYPTRKLYSYTEGQELLKNN